MNEFLRSNQDFIAPIIEWGGLLVLLAIILSPFLIIRLRRFRPTRWRHFLVAFLSSYTLFFAQFYLQTFAITEGNWFSVFLFRQDLLQPYTDSGSKLFILLTLAYPFLLIYSIKLLAKDFTSKQFIFSLIAAGILFILLFFGLAPLTFILFLYTYPIIIS